MGMGKVTEAGLQADGERVSVGQEIRVVRPQVLIAHLEVVLADWKVGPFTEAGEKGT